MKELLMLDAKLADVAARNRRLGLIVALIPATVLLIFSLWAQTL
jgi:hypothetical protein